MPRKNPKYHDWIKRQTSCSTCGVFSDSGLDPSHVKSRGSGGGDDKNLIPQCRKCHSNYHRLGRTLFEGLCRKDLRRLADEFWNTWKVLQSNPSRTTTIEHQAEGGETMGNGKDRTLPDEGINGLSGAGEMDLYQQEIKAAARRSRRRLGMVQSSKKGGHHGKV